MTLPRLRGLALLGAGLLVAAPALAQYQGAFGTTWNNGASASISYYIQGNMQRQAMFNHVMASRSIYQAQNGRSSSPRPTAKPKPRSKPLARGPEVKAPEPKQPAVQAVTSFKAVPGRLLPSRIAEKSGGSPEERKRLEGMLHQVLNQWETQALNRVGAARFSDLWDLGKVIPYAVVVSHSVYKGGGLPPREQIQKAQQTLGAELHRSPAVSAMSDEKKQELYEMQALMTHLLETGRDAAQRSGNPEAERRIQAMAGEFLKSLVGKDPDKVEITAQGLVFKP